jgi:four helix bundle protein
MQDFRHLEVWQVAHSMTLRLYRETASFPQSEMYGLTSQLRRAAASIGANLAEGCGRGGDADFRRFVQIAMGSASELEYHLLLARDLGLLAPQPYQDIQEQLGSVKRMLSGLLKRLRPTADSR